MQAEPRMLLTMAEQADDELVTRAIRGKGANPRYAPWPGEDKEE